MHKYSTSGITGVYARGKKMWQAKICVNYRKYDLGTFYNKSDAILARDEKQNFRYFGEFAPRVPSQ